MISPASVYLLACTWFVVTEEGPTPTFEDTAEEVVEVPDVETGVVEDTEVFDTEAPVFSAELSEVPTMATALELRWEAEGVDRVSASLHLEDGALREVDDLPQEGLVLAPEQSLVLVELTFWREDVVIGTASATASTGTLPEERTPILTMAEGSRVADMAVLYTLSDGDTVTVTLMSGAGQPLWRLGSEALEGYTPTAVQQDLGQPGVVVSRNAGQATGYSSETEGSANDFARYDWRGVLSETLDAPHSHHLFDQPSPGVVAWIKARRADFDEEQDIVWDQIVVSSFEGEERVVVDTEALGDFGQPCAPEGFYPGACDVHHTNSVDCRPDKNTCLISLHNVHRVLEISLATGLVVEDWTGWPGESEDGQTLTAFERAHDVHWSADGSAILVFNDGAGGGFASRLEPVVSSNALVERWGYGRDLCLATQALGTLQELPDGHHLAGFSAPNDLLREVDGEGAVLWEADFAGLADEERCDAEMADLVLGEARAYDVTSLGAGVIALF